MIWADISPNTVGGKHMKTCSTSLFTREKQVNITMKLHYTCTRVAVMEKMDALKYWQGVGQLELSHTSDEK